MLRALGRWLRAGYWLIAGRPAEPPREERIQEIVEASNRFAQRSRPILRHWGNP